MEENTRPHYHSFKVGDAALWGAEYPFDLDPERGKEKLRDALDFGITHFIDLTGVGELLPYKQLLPDGVEHLRFAIPDLDAPESVEEVHKLILKMDEILSNPNCKIYLHCWGGVGRTGTIAACWLAYKEGLNYTSTMKLLNELWKKNPKSKRVSSIPETSWQKRFVMDYTLFLKGNRSI